MSLDIEEIYKKDPSMVCRTIEDESVLVPVGQSTGELKNTYTLNEAGARIWEMLDGKNSLAAIKQQIISEYLVSAEEAEIKILDFMKSLKDIGAIN